MPEIGPETWAEMINHWREHRVTAHNECVCTALMWPLTRHLCAEDIWAIIIVICGVQ